jgi:hypothetical protein
MQSNKEFLREFARAGLFTFVVLGVFFAFVLLMGRPEERTRPEDRFKVVDTYGPCEIVRFMPKGEAKYVYFLDCK